MGEMKAVSPKLLVSRLKELDLWPLSASVVSALEVEMEAHALRASEAFVVKLSRKKVAAVVAAKPDVLAAVVEGGANYLPPPLPDGGSD